MISKKLLFFVILFPLSQIHGQKERVSSYNVLNIEYQINSKWYAYAEGQLRGTEDYSYPDYYEIKGGIGREVGRNNKVLIGLGRYANYEDHALKKEEFRIWIQDAYAIKRGRFKFENRVRAEKSWNYEPQSDEHSQRIRLRYRLNVSAPLNSAEVQPGTISGNAYNEVFFVVTQNPLFARNRTYAGLSYKIDDLFSLAGGYLWQRDFSSKGNRNLHFLYLALSVDIDPERGK